MFVLCLERQHENCPVPLCLLSFSDKVLSRRTQRFCQPATHCCRVLTRILKDMILQEGRMMQIRNKSLTGEKFATYFNTERKQIKYISYRLWINGVQLNYPHFFKYLKLILSKSILLLGMNPVTRIQKPLPLKYIN